MGPKSGPRQMAENACTWFDTIHGCYITNNNEFTILANKTFPII